MQEKYPIYHDKFPQWAAHSDGIVQHIVWTALAMEGLGANLQHYNPLIDKDVHKYWNVPEDWELSGQMVFGTPAGEAPEKILGDLNEQMRVYGA